MRAREVYEFGEFALDVVDRRLSRQGGAITLAPKAHDLLVALVRRAGRLVTKRELLDLVWPDTFVDEGILSVHVSTLRKALTDGHRGASFIETVPRSGYRFAGSVLRRGTEPDPFGERWLIPALPAEPRVHELIGRGRCHLLTASMLEVPKAVVAFRSAIELDPTYAAAHAGLALACCAQAELRVVPHGEAYAEARSAALRALAMDDTCADAQVALGAVLFLSDWNWTGARRSLERALELNPDHTEAYLLYGRLLEALGDFEHGLAAKQKALERQPASALVHTQIALSYWNQRRYDDMIAWAEKSLALDPKHLLAREYIAAAYLKKGDGDRHMAENLAHAEAYGAPAAVIAELREVYATGGRAAVVEHALRAPANQSAPAFHLALLHGEAGRMDEAFAHLDRAIESRDPALVHLAVAPQWDDLRADARFEERLARMGLRGNHSRQPVM
jgi:DNA-binding winged helix-turn-helix (wHTH) protein/tetratricopeptide (TPR) repeat protein